MNDSIRRMKESKGLAVLLSVLIACILWIFVVSAENPDVRDTIRNIPITLTGEAQLQEKGLILTGQSMDDVKISLTGKRNTLVNLNNKNITVSADLSEIVLPGRYEILCRVSLPDAITGGAVTVDNGETQRVTVDIEYRTEKTVEINGVLSGSVAKGFQGGEFALSPASVCISGPAGLLDSVAYAQVSLNGNNLKESFSGMLPVELVDHSGAIIDNELITCEVSSVHADYPIEMVREVDLAVDFVSGGGATEKHVSYEISPESLILSGPEEVLSDLDELFLGEVDLSAVSENDVLTFDIQLPEGVSCEDETLQAKVSVTMKGLASKTVEVSRISLVNVPEGYVAGLISGSVSVVVRGTEAAVNAVQENQLTAEVDLADISPVHGEMEVPVRISMPQMNDAGIVQTGYSVRIALTGSLR